MNDVYGFWMTKCMEAEVPATTLHKPRQKDGW
jgi:hypothetical protein